MLLEKVRLAEEILEKGAGDGRGVRLAAIVMRLYEISQVMEIPITWVPEEPVITHESLDEIERAIDEAWTDETYYPKDGEYELV